MASAMKARGLWLDLLGDYDTALSCKTFHIDRQTHTLEMARTAKAFTAYRYYRGRCPRAISTAKSTERDSAINTMPMSYHQ